MMSLFSLIYYLIGVFILFGGLVIMSAINPINRVIWLIFVFTGGAFLFLILDFVFLGLTYIIVYVGAESAH
jgi:NADH:ubiquinone oxidoreductase subunit 6 (subunit J)